MSGALKAVSIGGGTGQPRLIRALRLMGASIDSVVAMADDGGSTGLLREREHVVPPGDVRKCLSALASDPESVLARSFAHRFTSIDDHALGNLLLVALAKESGSFIDAIRVCEGLLGCVGRVHPSTLELVSLSGSTRDGDVVHGQARISYGVRAFSRVWLDQDEIAANDDAVAAILDADLVVLGPGSLFTSIMPNILVPGIRDALVRTRAVRVFVCPKIDSLGETSGMSVADHVEALCSGGGIGRLEAVLVHRTDREELVYPYEKRAWERAVADAARAEAGPSGVVSAEAIAAAKEAPFGPIRADDADIERIGRFADHVVLRDFTGGGSPAVHDARILSEVLGEVVSTCRSARR
ncbi:MAG: gluconeogenesis factor YvcK family protein [Collinsella sp.]|nr:gluconeogenesis factor YvcK family protein [Collinsella sp.]